MLYIYEANRAVKTLLLQQIDMLKHQSLAITRPKTESMDRRSLQNTMSFLRSVQTNLTAPSTENAASCNSEI